MSDINFYRTRFNLSQSMGQLVTRLQGALDGLFTSQNGPLQWHALKDRELHLHETYLAVRAHSTSLNLTPPNTASLDRIVQQQAHLNAMATALNQVPVMKLALDQNPRWVRCQQVLQTIAKMVSARRPSSEILDLVEKTDTRIRRLTLDTHHRLAQVEQNVVGSLTVDTLQSLGYGLRAKGHTLLGSHKGTSLRATVELGGGLMLDTSAFDGMSCHKAVARIESALKERGVMLQRVSEDSKTRSQGVRLQVPFPAFDQVIKEPPVKGWSGKESQDPVETYEWLKVQRQYHQQRLHLKEG